MLELLDESNLQRESHVLFMYLDLHGAVPIPVQSRSIIMMLFTEAEA